MCQSVVLHQLYNRGTVGSVANQQTRDDKRKVTAASVRVKGRSPAGLIFGSSFATCWSKAQGPWFSSARRSLLCRGLLRCWLATRGKFQITGRQGESRIPGLDGKRTIPENRCSTLLLGWFNFYNVVVVVVVVLIFVFLLRQLSTGPATAGTNIPQLSLTG